MSIDPALWPYVLVIVAGFLPTEIWRSLAVVFVRGLDENSEWLILVRGVATALLAAVIARLVLLPPGELATLPLFVRIGAVAVGFVAYLAIRRSVLIGILAGEAVIVGAAWYFG